jgi:hypothetical protein
MILFVASTGIIVALPNVYQSPILVVIPIVLFLVFLFTLDIG